MVSAPVLQEWRTSSIGSTCRPQIVSAPVAWQPRGRSSLRLPRFRASAARRDHGQPRTKLSIRIDGAGGPPCLENVCCPRGTDAGRSGLVRDRADEASVRARDVTVRTASASPSWSRARTRAPIGRACTGFGDRGLSATIPKLLSGSDSRQAIAGARQLSTFATDGAPFTGTDPVGIESDQVAVDGVKTSSWRRLSSPV